MKKIAYLNFNVGSAIQFAGSIFKEWILETTKSFPTDGETPELHEIVNQDQSTYIFSKLVEINPDIIILNEKYQRSVESALYFKILKPATQIFFIVHVWKDFDILNLDMNRFNEERSLFDKLKFKEFCETKVDRFTVLNYKPDGNFSKYPINTNHVFNTSYPTDPEKFKVTTEWKDRGGKFLYLGNIVPHKMSLEFINKIKETNIEIDCYGKNDFTDDVITGYSAYIDVVKNTPNLKLKGYAPQESVGEIFNQYKYFVLPHDGYEPFNWTILQSINCGTIPLIINDTNSKKYDSKWLDWATGLYMGTDTVEQFIENLNIINSDDTIDMNDMSNAIASEAKEKFDYNKHKSHFQSVLSQMLAGTLVEIPMPRSETNPVIAGTGKKCSSHNGIYYSLDNASYDSSVDASNDTGVDPGDFSGNGDAQFEDNDEYNF